MMRVKESVLVLEDDGGLREVLCEALQEEGFSVVGAGNAKQAVASALETGFDLIVADIRMAGMDGLDAVEAVRGSQPQIRTIVMTGYASDAESLRALRLRIDDYLRKPFEVDVFLRVVERQIRAAREQGRLLKIARSVRSLMIWSLEGRLESAARHARGLARLCEQVALHLGLEEMQAQECRILCLAEYLRHQGHELDFTLLEESLGGWLRNWLHQSEESEEQEDLVLRVARAGVRRLLQQPEPDPQGQMAQAFLAAANEGTPQAQGRQVVRRRGSLLALAQACELADPKQARELYQQILDDGSPTQESLSASLGLCRLQPERLAELVQPTLSLARQVGPLAFAQTSLNLALSLGGQEGVSLLAPAVRIFTQIPGSSGAFRAELAQFVLESRPFEARLVDLLFGLEQSATLPEWQSLGSWLFPYLSGLIVQDQRPEVARALLRLLRNVGPGLVSQIMRRPAPERRALLNLFQDQRQGVADALLKAWEAQESDDELRQLLQAKAAIEPGEPAGSVLRLYSLGPIQVSVGDELLPDSAWVNRKHLLLLIFLGLFPKRHSEDVIIDSLWPDKDAASGRNNINTALSGIRRTFKKFSVDPELLQRDRLGIMLQPGPLLWHDLEQFQAGLQEAQQHSGARRQELLRGACRLYRGPVLGGQYFHWSDSLRQQLEERFLEALHQLCELCLSSGHSLEALEHAHRILEIDPCSQNACGSAMRAHLLLGRPEEAVRTFERVRRSLWEELAIEPAIFLLELRQRALLSQS
ncbi:MAG: response regulator [Vulcanimicrobiota bacterium]